MSEFVMSKFVVSKFVSLDQVFSLIKLTILIFGLLTIIIMATNHYVEPIKCSPNKVFGLSEEEVQTRCFEEIEFFSKNFQKFDSKFDSKFDLNYQTEQELDNFIYLNSLKDRIGQRKVYKLNYQFLPFLIGIGIIMHFWPIIIWYYKQIDMPNNEVALLERIKESIQKQTNFKSHSSSYLVLAILQIIHQSVLLEIGMQMAESNYFNFGFKWLTSSSRETRPFPRQIRCQIVEPQIHKDQNKLNIDLVVNDSMICDLKLNAFYESIFLIFWFWNLFLLLVLIVCLFQQIGLMKSKSYRLQRILELLPSIEEPVREKIANNQNSFFILEALSARIKDRTKLSRVMKNLIDQNYYEKEKEISV